MLALKRLPEKHTLIKLAAQTNKLCLIHLTLVCVERRAVLGCSRVVPELIDLASLTTKSAMVTASVETVATNSVVSSSTINLLYIQEAVLLTQTDHGMRFDSRNSLQWRKKCTKNPT